MLSDRDSLDVTMAKMAAMNPNFRGLCFLHQLYASSDANKTSLDTDLEKHKERGDVRAMMTQLGVALLKNTDYLEELRRAESKEGKGEAYYSALRKFSGLMQQFNKMSITKTELIQSHGFTSGEISELQSALFLLSRRDVEVQGLYWLYCPYFSHVITDLTNMRSKILRAIKRSRFKEMSASALRGVVMAGRGASEKKKKRDTEWDNTNTSTGQALAGERDLACYYFMDLVGSGQAKAVLTPGGSTMYRIK